MSRLQRWTGTARSAQIGTGLILLGLALIVYSAAAYVGLVPGGYTSVPAPVALGGNGQRVARLATPAPLPAQVQEPAAAVEPRAASAARVATEPAAAEPSPAPVVAVATPVAHMLQPADADDRRAAAAAPRPGIPLRLVLPTIEVDTEVKPGGIVQDPSGELIWETLPFVATTYPMLGMVGAPGNPVISGHVVTLREGNVFRDLYRLVLGDPIAVYTADSRFDYVVDEIKLVKPDAVEVMAPTPDARLTLITCGGTFDPRTRTFSDRLVVVGKLAGGERLGRPADAPQ